MPKNKKSFSINWLWSCVVLLFRVVTNWCKEYRQYKFYAGQDQVRLKKESRAQF